MFWIRFIKESIRNKLPYLFKYKANIYKRLGEYMKKGLIYHAIHIH